MTIRLGPIYAFLSASQGWIRLGTKGLAYQDVTKHQLLFSQRRNLRPSLTIGKWRFKTLMDVRALRED